MENKELIETLKINKEEKEKLHEQYDKVIMEAQGIYNHCCNVLFKVQKLKEDQQIIQNETYNNLEGYKDYLAEEFNKNLEYQTERMSFYNEKNKQQFYEQQSQQKQEYKNIYQTIDINDTQHSAAINGLCCLIDEIKQSNIDLQLDNERILADNEHNLRDLHLQ